MSKAGQILRLAGNNYIHGLAEHHRDAATKQLNQILDAAEQFNAHLAATRDDTSLSPEGRVEAGRTVAAAALAKLASVDVAVKTLTERATSLEQALLAKV